MGPRVTQQQPAQPTNTDAINQLSEAIGQLDSAIANKSTSTSSPVGSRSAVSWPPS